MEPGSLISALPKIALVVVGGGLIADSKAAARSLVQTKRVPSWMPMNFVRSIYVVGGGTAILAGLKVLFWPS